MQIVRRLGNVILTLLAVVGLLSVLLWGATALGLVKPLVVISGSMEPGIMTGDLLIAARHDTADVRVGQVTSIYSEITGNIVTHRVVSIDEGPGGQWQIRMKGDANEAEDGAPYVVGADVLQPVLQLPGVGYAVVSLTKPSVALPLAVALLAVLGIVLYPTDQPRGAREDDDQQASAPSESTLV